jgi:hypothetical protein
VDAVDRFAGKCGAKHEKRVTCLAKDRAVLRAFCDFPAEPLRGLPAGSISSIGPKASRPLVETHPQPGPDREHIRAVATSDPQDHGLSLTRNRADPVSSRDRRERLLAVAGLKLAMSAERLWRRPDGTDRGAGRRTPAVCVTQENGQSRSLVLGQGG